MDFWTAYPLGTAWPCPTDVLSTADELARLGNCVGLSKVFERRHVAAVCEAFAVFAVGFVRGGRPRSETVDVTVVHAEGSGDEDGVVDFEVCRAEGAGGRDVGRG